MKHRKKTELELSRKYHEVFDLYLPGVCMHAKSLQPCLTLSNPMDHSSVHGILQARILEWVTLPFPRDLANSDIESLISFISCIGRWILYLWCHLGSPLLWYLFLGSSFKRQWFAISFRKETEISKVLLLMPQPQVIIWSFVSTLLFSWKRI